MTIKTLTVYACTIFSILVIIITLATNYWHEFEIPDNRNASNVRHFRVGLFEQCETYYINHEEEVHDESDDKGCDDYNVPVKIEDVWEARRDTVLALYIIALILTLIAFVFVNIYCVTGKYYFPIGRSAICYFFAALLMFIALIVYTATYNGLDVAFSWSYGAGWSCIAMYIITIILLYADK